MYLRFIAPERGFQEIFFKIINKAAGTVQYLYAPT